MEIGKNPNYIGSYDLYDLNVNETTVTIAGFREDNVVTNGQTEKCAVMTFKENYKPMIINPTNKKTLSRLFHTVMGEKMVGHKISIKIEKVKAFGKLFDALRIKETLPAQTEEKCEKCEECGKDIKPIAGMNSAQVAKYTKSKYGYAYCSECAVKAKAEAEKTKENEEEVIDESI